MQGKTCQEVYRMLEEDCVVVRVRSHPFEHTHTMERRMEGGQLERLGLTFLAGVIIRTVPGTPAARLSQDLVDHVILAINGVWRASCIYWLICIYTRVVDHHTC